MTIYFPDVSWYNRGAKIQPGTVALIARATLSTSYADPSYADFKQQASNVGAFFVAYHWLNHGNVVQQAIWAHNHIGDTPLMIDAEDMPGNSGYNGPITVADLRTFTTAYRAAGGTVNLVYLPHWYWSGHMGSPDLTPLVNAGLHLIASEYRPYSDNNWPAAYGHMNPEEWQYTNALPYGGQAVDFNAYKGSIAEFISIAGTGKKMNMKGATVYQKASTGACVVCDGLVKVDIPDIPTLERYATLITVAGGDATVRGVGDAEWDLLINSCVDIHTLQNLVNLPAPVTVAVTDEQLSNAFHMHVDHLAASLAAHFKVIP